MPDSKKIFSKPAVGDNKVKSYQNDEFVVKKAEASKAFLEKHGFPKEFKSRMSEK